jgi:hypothetical protein
MRYLVIIIFLVGTVFTSCEKVIDIDLNDTEKRYVVEGFITDQAGQCQVTITQTKNFDEDNTFPPVTGASVSITDNSTGVVTQLSEVSPGIYKHVSLAGVSGKTYKLRVSINGAVFTASSTIPQLVTMDTIYTTTDTWLDGEIKLANIEYDDPVGIANSYKFVRYRNGVKTKQIFIDNDILTDGRRSVTVLFNDAEDDELKSGDEVKIDMLCIDPVVYKYWYSLEQGATGNPQSATPANPVTNITGGALGYFSAHTYQTKTMRVP